MGKSLGPKNKQQMDNKISGDLSLLGDYRNTKQRYGNEIVKPSGMRWASLALNGVSEDCLERPSRLMA